MNSISAIPAFVAVVKGEGFSAAANRLGVSKSAVSKRINQLEQELGVRLFYRTTRKLSLTEAGERYFEHAEKALKAACMANDAVAELQGEPQGKLKISSPMSFGRLHVAPLIPKLLVQCPKLDIELIMDDRPIDLISEGVDIAIRSGSGVLKDSSLVARKLAPLRQGIYASSKYLAHYGIPKTPDELTEHNCILFSYSSDSNIWIFNKDSKEQLVEVKGNYRVNNSEAILSGIIDGLGVGRLPTYVANKYVKRGELVNLFPQYQIPEHTFYAVFPGRQYLPQKVRVFLNFALQYYGDGEPYWDR